MIHKLEKSDFCTVKELLSGIKNFPEIHAVIDCINPGKVYTDNSNSPKSALIWNQGMQGFYFIGEANNETFKKEIKEYIDNILIDELLEYNINWFEISAISEKWEDTIEELFVEKGIQYEYQLVYRMNEKLVKYDKDENKCKYSIEKLKRDVMKSNISNIDYITKELELFWGTMDNFFNHGTCYLAIENNKIASVCYSGFKADNVETIGIETLSDYRKKGYAYDLATKFINACNEKGSIPYWDCSKDNLGSVVLAEKLGFEKKDEYRCYWFNF